MSERARKYFNTYPSPNEPKYLTIFGYLFSFNWANENWTWITDRETEKTNYFHIGKVRNMKGQTCYELVIWRLLIIWGK
jgi:hypothetical protein